MRDFFISYSTRDDVWAQWIAWQLEKAGYSTFVQAWDFAPGSNFVERMQEGAAQTRRTIAVLSPNYLESRFTKPEWYAAFAADPTGTERKLLPVRIAPCDLSGLLAQIVYIDLFEKPEEDARDALLKGVDSSGQRPDVAPAFPGSAPPAFPGDARPTPAAAPSNTAPKASKPPPPGVSLLRNPTVSEFRNLLHKQESIIVVQGADQTDIKELIAPCLSDAYQEGVRVVSVDLESFSAAQLKDEETYFRALASIVARQLKIETRLQNCWDDGLSAMQNLQFYLEDNALSENTRPLLLNVHRVDMLSSQGYHNEAFAFFRFLHNQRANRPGAGWERLTVLLQCSGDPNRFIDNPKMSPFNVGTWLEFA